VKSSIAAAVGKYFTIGNTGRYFYLNSADVTKSAIGESYNLRFNSLYTCKFNNILTINTYDVTGYQSGWNINT